MSLYDLIRNLPDIAARLDAFESRAEDRRQIPRFRNRFYPCDGNGAPANC